jgi:hypothetical protein
VGLLYPEGGLRGLAGASDPFYVVDYPIVA